MIIRVVIIHWCLSIVTAILSAVKVAMMRLSWVRLDLFVKHLLFVWVEVLLLWKGRML